MNIETLKITQNFFNSLTLEEKKQFIKQNQTLINSFLVKEKNNKPPQSKYARFTSEK